MRGRGKGKGKGRKETMKTAKGKASERLGLRLSFSGFVILIYFGMRDYQRMDRWCHAK
jgi:hypothetical protein